ncbi:hypothetical protein LXL04_023996 [Taraxacum kok-saghyz]
MAYLFRGRRRKSSETEEGEDYLVVDVVGAERGTRRRLGRSSGKVATQRGFGSSESTKRKRDAIISSSAKSRSFENSYIPENPRTPKPLTFLKNRLRGAKNRSNISPVAKKNFRKNDFFFPKNFAYVQKIFLCICAQSIYNTYLKRFVKKNLKKTQKKKKRIVMIKNVLEGSEVGFLKGITIYIILRTSMSISAKEQRTGILPFIILQIKIWIPIKENILIWRIMKGRMPIRCSLAEMDIDVLSINCEVCGDQAEDIRHLFLKCDLASWL